MAPTIKTPSRSKTGPQIVGTVINYADNTLIKEGLSTGADPWHEVVKDLIKDPTIALVRGMLILPVVSSEWSVIETKGAPSGAKEFIEQNLFPLRTHVIRQAFYGCVDFGWAPFEKVFDVKDGMIVLKKLKPLLQEYTVIRVIRRTGAFNGFYNGGNLQAQMVVVDIPEYGTSYGWTTIQLPYAFLHSWDVRGTYWYGRPLLKNLEDVYNWWKDTNDSNSRYDKKVAGAQWVVKYPLGKSLYKGVETDNGVIAQDILDALQSSGGIAIPKRIEDTLQDLQSQSDSKDAWEITLLESRSSNQAGYIERLSYLDKLKARGFGFPERAILEGRFGTKAEAETHSDMAIALQDSRHDELLRDLNWHVVNQLLELNYGPDAKDTVKLVRAPISPETRKFLREVYRTILATKEGWSAEVGSLDMRALRELVSVPMDPDAPEKIDAEPPQDSQDQDQDQDQNNEPNPRGSLEPGSQNPEGEQE